MRDIVGQIWRYVEYGDSKSLNLPLEVCDLNLVTHLVHIWTWDLRVGFRFLAVFANHDLYLLMN
jgi:hypothetical protein